MPSRFLVDFLICPSHTKLIAYIFEMYVASHMHLMVQFILPLHSIVSCRLVVSSLLSLSLSLLQSPLCLLVSLFGKLSLMSLSLSISICYVTVFTVQWKWK